MGRKTDINQKIIREILIKDIIYSPGVFILYAKPKVGKSYFALQLAAEISRNIGFMFPGLGIKKRKALYISTELDYDELMERVDFCYSSFSDDLNNYFNNLNFLDTYDDIITRVSNEINEHGYSFIVIDMLVDTINIDIDRVKDVNPLLDKFKKLSREYKCSFLMVMHANENNSNALSHSQAFRRRPDGILYLERVSNNIFSLYSSMRATKSTKFTFRQNEKLLFVNQKEIISDVPYELNEIIKYVSSRENKEFKGSNQDIINKCNLKISAIKLGNQLKQYYEALKNLGLTITINGNNSNRKLWSYQEPNEE